MKRLERVSDPAVPVARPPKVAKGSTDGTDACTQPEKSDAAARDQEREKANSMDAEGLAIEAEHKAEAMTQAEKFEAAARELGCDPDEDRFNDVLRKLAKPKI